MRGDQIQLPIIGHVRRHEWTPAREVSISASLIRRDNGENLARILLAVEQHPGLTAKEIADKCGVPYQIVRTQLSFQSQAGTVTHTGKRGNYRYARAK